MPNTMIPYQKGPDENPSKKKPGKASVAGIDQVEIESSECVIYTSQKSGDQLMLSVMWAVLLAISIVLLALGMFAMDFSIRLILAGVFTLGSLVICSQLYRYYKWDWDRYTVLTDRNLYTNALYHGRNRLPPVVIALDKIEQVHTRYGFWKGHSVVWKMPIQKEEHVECELRFLEAEEFHNFLDILLDALRQGLSHGQTSDHSSE